MYIHFLAVWTWSLIEFISKYFAHQGWNALIRGKLSFLLDGITALRVLRMVNHTYVMVLPEAWIRGERPFSWRQDWVFYFTGIGNLAFQLRYFGIKLMGILEMILYFLRFKKRRFISRKFGMRIPSTPPLDFLYDSYIPVTPPLNPT